MEQGRNGMGGGAGWNRVGTCADGSTPHHRPTGRDLKQTDVSEEQKVCSMVPARSVEVRMSLQNPRKVYIRYTCPTDGVLYDCVNFQ